MSGPTPVLILGRGLTALAALRSFGRAGIPALLAVRQPGFVRTSRWFPDGRPPPLEPPWDDLPAYLEGLTLERAVLLPCSDDWVRRVARLPEGARERFPASVPPADAVSVLVDKGRFAEHLAARRLPHPPTWPVNGARELSTACRGRGARLFLKPRRSQPFFRRFGVKGVMIGDTSAVCETLERSAEEGLALLVQEYVPGPASNHYFVDGFVDAGGRVRGLMVRRRLRMYPRDFGSSSHMVSVAADEASGAVELVRDLLAGLGYRGIFSAELKRDERDGAFRILEVNARPWIFVEFAARCGLDVCRMAYDDALGRTVPPVDAYEIGRRLVYPYYDAQACLALIREGELSVACALRSWLGADVPTFAWDDPAPALRGAAGRVAGFLARRISGGRRRAGP